jgi:SAM-dependent methyltransferase
MRATRWWFGKPVRFDYLDAWLKGRPVRILDVGCGNHSPRHTKRYYPQCRYSGIDKGAAYNLDAGDLACMENFYDLDLDLPSSLDMIPDGSFDCVILSHVIEHLHNSEEVIRNLLRKLRSGGVLYIEFPSPHSVNLPSMWGTLNFYDDPTHVTLHSIESLRRLLDDEGCQTLRSGVRRSAKMIMLIPLYALHSLLKRGRVGAGVVWDLTGFASFIIAVKP